MSIQDVAGINGLSLKVGNVELDKKFESDAYFTLRGDGRIGVSLTRSRDGGRVHRIDAAIPIEVFDEVVQALRNGESVM